MFEELDAQETRLGLLTLRRRFDPVLEAEIYEVKLGDEFLMSSAFTVAERELARLGLGATPGQDLDVLVGGLGLGYTAVQALDDARIRSLTVVEALPAVINWHERGLLPETALASDPRTTLLEADFFALMRAGQQLPEGMPDQFHAILLDIDHTPRHLLHPAERAVERQPHPGGGGCRTRIDVDQRHVERFMPGGVGQPGTPFQNHRQSEPRPRRVGQTQDAQTPDLQ